LNNITRISLLLVALASATTLCFGQASKPGDEPPPAPAVEYNPGAWKEFTSAGGRFSVLLPGTPTEKIESHDSPVGRLEVHDFSLKTFAQYGVMYVEYPPNVEEGGDAKRFLDGAISAGLKAAGGTLLEEQEIALDGHPGRYVKVQLSEGYVMRIRSYLVKNRLYQIGITMKEAGAPKAISSFDDETAARFLGSFKLVPGVAETQHPVVRDEETTLPDAAADAAPAARAEDEMDRLLRSLREKGETVVGVCAEGDKCQPIPDVEGFKDGDKVVTIKVINKPPPVYPPIAKAARAQGTVKVQVVVDEEGKVIAARAIGGHPLLQAAAVKAAREVLFSPVLLGTKPVKVSGVITYNFVLQ